MPPLDCEVLGLDWTVNLDKARSLVGEGPDGKALQGNIDPNVLFAQPAQIEADLVLPADPRPQPLAARYGPAMIEPLRAGLATGGPLTRIVTELGPEVIATGELRRFGDPAVMFSNVNDPGDLARIEATLRGQSSTSSTRAL